MARTVVIGGGYGGMAAAARLAKLGHEVTLIERRDRLGGALGLVEADGFAWQSGPTSTLLPATVRDLFRKSGRPLERELELEHRDLVREHRFEDGTRLRLPGSSRDAQHTAVEGLGTGLGGAWVDYVHGFSTAWEVLRHEYAERPWDAEVASEQARALLGSRTSLRRHARRGLPDPRLRLVAEHRIAVEGHDPRRTPWWAGLGVHLEQRFGVWQVPSAAGGMAGLADALERRLATRRVEVRTGVAARDVVVEGGALRGVAVAGPDGADADAELIPAELVVCAIDPRRLPALAPIVRRTVPTMPATTVHVGLDERAPDLPVETVLHGEATFEITTGHRAPAGARAWTISARGRVHEDLLEALARRGIDLRPHLLRRVDRSVRAQVEQWGGSPYGVLWEGRSTALRRIGPRTPLPGVLCAGAHAVPGAGLPFVGLSAALVAQTAPPARPARARG